MTIGDENFMRAQAVTTPTDEDRRRLVAHLDRDPPAACECWHKLPSHFTPDADGIRACAICACDCFSCAPSESWRRWYAWTTPLDSDATVEPEYLGEVSARTGPDPVDSKQKCTCAVCAVTSKQGSEDGQP